MDKKLTAWVVIALVVVGLGALLFFKKSPAPPQTTYQPSTPAPIMMPQPATVPASTKTITVPLASQNNSGESGTATLVESNGKIIVTLALNGAPNGVTQPAHIHTGSCATIGGIVFPLTSPINGASQTTLDTTLDGILQKLPLAINIHKSTAESNVFVACGDIANTNASSPSSASGNQQPTTSTPAVKDNNRNDGGTFSTPTDKRKGADKPENY